MKKYIGIAAVALLLAGAVWWSISSDNAKLPDPVQSTQGDTGDTVTDPGYVAVSAPNVDYYEAFRSQRTQTREMELEYLDEIIASSPSDSQTLEDAQAQKLTLVAQMESEFAIEQLILAKGFADAAVTFHQGNINVVVDAAELTGEQAAQILEIVQNETGVSAENVKITPNPK